MYPKHPVARHGPQWQQDWELAKTQSIHKLKVIIKNFRSTVRQRQLGLQIQNLVKAYFIQHYGCISKIKSNLDSKDDSIQLKVFFVNPPQPP